MIFDEKYFYRPLSGINSNIDFIVNSIDFQYNTTFMQSSGVNIFYRRLSAINNNVDFIVNSIDFRYNKDNNAFMQSSGIYIFIGAYWQ